METDMSPIDDSYDQEPPHHLLQREQPFYQEEPQYFKPPSPQPYQPQQTQQKSSFFPDFDKSTWLVIGLLILIAFFMGKTMQPVFIRA